MTADADGLTPDRCGTCRPPAEDSSDREALDRFRDFLREVNERGDGPQRCTCWVLIVAIWWLLRWHDTRICDRCQVLALREDDPGALAERRLRTLRALHAVWNLPGYVAVLAVLAVVLVPYATRAMGFSFIPGFLVLACIVTVVMRASLLHGRLIPWCPWCRFGGGGTTVPEPVPIKEVR